MPTKFSFFFGQDEDHQFVSSLIITADLALVDEPDDTYAPGSSSANPVNGNQWYAEWIEASSGVLADEHAALRCIMTRYNLTDPVLPLASVAITKSGTFPGDPSLGPVGMKGEYLYMGCRNGYNKLVRTGWAAIGNGYAGQKKRFDIRALSGGAARVENWRQLLNRTPRVGVTTQADTTLEFSQLGPLDPLVYHGVKG